MREYLPVSGNAQDVHDPADGARFRSACGVSGTLK